MTKANIDQGIYTLPKEYTPTIAQLIATGQADVSKLSPRLRSALGRTAQHTGLFIFKRYTLIEATKEIKIITQNEKNIKIQANPETPLDTI